MTTPDAARRPQPPAGARPEAYPGIAADLPGRTVLVDCPICRKELTVPAECCHHLFRHAEGQPGSVDVLCRWPSGPDACIVALAWRKTVRDT